MQHLREKPRAGARLDLSHPLNKGLVGCWLFNEGSGIRAFDSSSYKNHGVLTNMAIPSCRSSLGLAFDGVDDYVDAGNDASLNITDAITVEAWVNGTWNNDVSPLSKSKWVTTEQGWFYRYLTTGGLYLVFGNGTTTTSLGYNSFFPANNTWYHILVTRSGSNFIYYVNGVQKATTSSNLDIRTTENLTIGSKGASKYFNGSIDEVRIYNRALSAEEIKELYINPYGMFL